MTSYYDLLGIAADADFEEVRRAYHRQAQLLHPDRHPESSGDEMKALNEAWHTLRDAAARRRYDVELGLLPPDPNGEIDVWDGVWPAEGDEPAPRTNTRLRKVWLISAVLLVVAMLASAVAWFADPDAPSSRWSGAAVADLRLRALNAGMTAPQATCFVEAVTASFGPAEELTPAIVDAIAGACR